MRALAPLCALLLAAGCASGGKPAPPERAIVDVTVAEEECAGCPAADEAAPEAVIVAPTPEVVPSMEAECLQAASLVEAGEHKPAVETLDHVLEAGASCADPVLEAVGESQRRLAEADDLARRGLEARRAGDVAAARESFRRALAVYPKYYWVRKLEQDLPPESSGEVARLRQASASALAAGQPEEALELLEQAAVLPDAEPELSAEVARLRADLAAARLEQARRAQRSGDLERAIERVERAIAARPGPPGHEEVIDFARRLGLDLFSAGELVKARDLWNAALTLDRANGQLLQYLQEVEARLRTLDAIKDDG